MDRFTSILSCLIIAVLAQCPTISKAAEKDQPVQLFVDAPAELPPGGGDFLIKVTTGKVTQLKSYQIQLYFYLNGSETSVFEVISTTEGELFGPKNTISSDISHGRVSILQGEPISGSGAIASFAVSYEAKARGEYYIVARCVLVDDDAEQIPCQCDPTPTVIGQGVFLSSPPPIEDATKATATATDPPPLQYPADGGPLYCDVNGDGIVSVVDVTLAQMMLNEAIEGKMRYADVDDSGTINIIDLIRIQNRIGVDPATLKYTATGFSYERITQYPAGTAQDVWLVNSEGETWFTPPTYSANPLTLTVSCLVGPEVPVIGDLEWRVSNGRISNIAYDTQTRIASADVLVAAAEFTIKVYNRGLDISNGGYTITLTPVFAEHTSSEYVQIYDALSNHTVNNEYYGVFGTYGNMFAVEVLYHDQPVNPPRQYHPSFQIEVTDGLEIAYLNATDYYGMPVNCTVDTDPMTGDLRFTYDTDAPYDMFVRIEGYLRPTTYVSAAVGEEYFKAYIPPDYKPAKLVYTSLIVEDWTYHNYIAWAGWENMFAMSGEPETAADFSVMPYLADGLLRVGISGFSDFILLDDNLENVPQHPDGFYYLQADSVFDRVALDLNTDTNPHTPGFEEVALAISRTESSAVNDKTITVFIDNPYGHYDQNFYGIYTNPVDSQTRQYTVVRPDIDVDTNGDGTIETSGTAEQADDEPEFTTGVYVPISSSIAVGTTGLVPAKLRVTPASLALTGNLVLHKELDGGLVNQRIRIYKSTDDDADGDYDLLMDKDQNDIDVTDLAKTETCDVFIQGVDAGQVELRLNFVYEQNGNTLFKTFDRVLLNVGPDLDIDSDNTNGYDAPDRTEAEDEFEDVTGDADHPGKIIVVNDGDVDGDGIPDFADGYNRDATPGNEDDSCDRLQFAKIVLQLPDVASIINGKIKITYDSSDPANVTESDGDYQINDTGSLRLWKADGPARNLNAANATQDPGDFIPGAGGVEYTAAQLGINTTDPFTFYVEAIKPSTIIADQQIKVELDPDGDGAGWVWSEDAVRVTVQQLQLEGLQVYDPRLESDPNTPTAEIRYRLDSPSTVFDPRVELTVKMPGPTGEDIAGLMRKGDGPPPLCTDLTGEWDGMWSSDRDGNPTAHIGRFADPSEYEVEINLYLNYEATAPMFSKRYPLYLVRLGIQQISFSQEQELSFHKTTATDATNFNFTTYVDYEDFAHDLVWQLEGLDRFEAGWGNVEARRQRTPLGEDFTDNNNNGRWDTGEPYFDADGNSTWTSNLRQANFPNQVPHSTDITVSSGVNTTTFNRPVAQIRNSKLMLNVRLGDEALSDLVRPTPTVTSVGYDSLAFPFPIKIEATWRGGGFTGIRQSEATNRFRIHAGGDPISLESISTLPNTVGLDPEQISFKFYYNATKETFVDANGDGAFVARAAEVYTDDNLDGVWSPAEPYIDANGDGVWTGEPYTDADGNGVWTPGETFDDRDLNGTWTPLEPFIDLNGDGMYTAGEPFNDVYHDGIWTQWEPYYDRNGDGLWNDADHFTDADGNGTWTPEEKLLNDQDGDGLLDEDWVEIPGKQDTSHLIYRLAATPTTYALSQCPGHRLYVKILDFTCAWGQAAGAATPDDVFNAIWNTNNFWTPFTGTPPTPDNPNGFHGTGDPTERTRLDMWGAAPKCFTYQHNMGAGNGFTVEWLLDYNEGRCGAWSSTLPAFAGAHGGRILDLALRELDRRERGGHVDYLRVTGTATGFQVGDVLYLSNVTCAANGLEYGAALGVFRNLNGQGNPGNQPHLAWLFDNHAVCFRDGGSPGNEQYDTGESLFDPSYEHAGGTVLSIRALENAAVQHYYYLFSAQVTAVDGHGRITGLSAPVRGPLTTLPDGSVYAAFQFPNDNLACEVESVR